MHNGSPLPICRIKNMCAFKLIKLVCRIPITLLLNPIYHLKLLPPIDISPSDYSTAPNPAPSTTMVIPPTLPISFRIL